MDNRIITDPNNYMFLQYSNSLCTQYLQWTSNGGLMVLWLELQYSLQLPLGVSPFLLYSPCGVSTVYDLGVSALDLATTWLHLWLVKSCIQNGWVSREWISPWLKHHICRSPAWIARMLWWWLAGLFSSVCYGESFLGMVCYCQGGAALNSSRAIWWLVPSSSHMLEELFGDLDLPWSNDLLGSDDWL